MQAQQTQFLPLANINDKLSTSTIKKRLEKQADTMRDTRNELFNLVYRAFAKDILGNTDLTSDQSSLHIQFNLVECGMIHIDLSIQGEAFVRKFGGGADFLPYARPTTKFEGAYDSSTVSQWIIEAVKEVKASVIKHNNPVRQ